MVVILDGGLDALGPADSQNSLVVHMYMLIVPEIVINATVAFIRVFHVDLLYFLGKFLVLYSSCTPFPRRPAKVGCSGNMEQLTGGFNRIVFLCMAFLNGSVQMRLPHL